MSTPFLGELKIMSFNFPPKGWALCNGQFLPINQNQALFSLLGTQYGGNGQTTFALPDLRGRVPIHAGQGHLQGESSGEQAHTLLTSALPTHAHLVSASPLAGDQAPPAGTEVLASPLNLSYTPAGGNLIAMAAGTISNVGGSQAHSNMQPYSVLSFCIALVGIFPSRN